MGLRLSFTQFFSSFFFRKSIERIFFFFSRVKNHFDAGTCFVRRLHEYCQRDCYSMILLGTSSGRFVIAHTSLLSARFVVTVQGFRWEYRNKSWNTLYSATWWSLPRQSKAHLFQYVRKLLHLRSWVDLLVIWTFNYILSDSELQIYGGFSWSKWPWIRQKKIWFKYSSSVPSN